MNVSTPPSVALTLIAPTLLGLTPVNVNWVMKQLNQTRTPAKPTFVLVLGSQFLGANRKMQINNHTQIRQLACVCVSVLNLADIDECVKDATICGPDANCTNSIGSYVCTCSPGYRPINPKVIASTANPCTGLCALLPCGTCNVLHFYLFCFISSVCMFLLYRYRWVQRDTWNMW